jgi:hypothetical protein
MTDLEKPVDFPGRGLFGAKGLVSAAAIEAPLPNGARRADTFPRVDRGGRSQRDRLTPTAMRMRAQGRAQCFDCPPM